MEKVESKISVLYIGLVIFIHTIAITTIVISATYLRDIFYLEKRIIAGVIIIAIVFFLIIVWKDILSAKKIIVDSSGIEIYNVNSIRKIAFSEIDHVQKGKIKRMYARNIPLTEGYTYSEIILKQGESLIISPDKFDNYLDIMSLINSKIN